MCNCSYVRHDPDLHCICLRTAYTAGQPCAIVYALVLCSLLNCFVLVVFAVTIQGNMVV